MRIIGIVRDPQFRGPDVVPALRLFVPWRQAPSAGPFVVLAKSSRDPFPLAEEIAALARELRPSTGVQAARTLEELHHYSTADTRFAASLMAGFSRFAGVLTAVGVFGGGG